MGRPIHCASRNHRAATRARWVQTDACCRPYVTYLKLPHRAKITMALSSALVRIKLRTIQRSRPRRRSAVRHKYREPSIFDPDTPTSQSDFPAQTSPLNRLARPTIEDDIRTRPESTMPHRACCRGGGGRRRLVESFRRQRSCPCGRRGLAWAASRSYWHWRF